MGLDMYAYAVSAEYADDCQHDIRLWEDEQIEPIEAAQADTQFAYWRKFYQLHRWMEELYYQKGGEDEFFNCRTVRLELEDLDRLECALGTPEFASLGSCGEPDPEGLEYTKEFIRRSREAIDGGQAVFYDSWW
ncbi:hypothetical protein L1281_002499 [Neisseria sp. HSC-16F19]|nr:phosphoglycerate kinase [Neisseria sp. HSC-16F19]MCP2041881.1 hypothetical protein [Neisseria sp. HSC-16F19]